MADDDKPTEKTFTQADVDRLIRDRLAREREKYADYDELKKAAEAASNSKSQLDKIEAKLEAAEKRAEKAEAATLRREVADELGLTAKQASRLRGNTRDELLADGREYMEDNGIKPKSEREAGKPVEGSGDGEGETGKDDDAPPPARRVGRPREDLRSGAPMSQGGTEETDPMKLAAMVPRR